MLHFYSFKYPKILFPLLVFIFGFTMNSQDSVTYQDIFIRIYNQDGKKIAKGKLVSVNDSTLFLNLNGQRKTVPLASITTIKTKRSGGNNVAVGAGIGTVVFGVIGAISLGNDPFWNDSSLGAGLGAIAGAPAGAIAGAIVASYKKKKIYSINGNTENLKLFANDYVK